jgi:hypothetical protein
MAWVDVPGSPTVLVSGTPTAIWQYDNAPTLGTLAAGAKVHPDDQYYREANGTVTNGIRSFTPPGGNTQETYVKCRRVQPAAGGKIYTDSNANGPWSELSKNYFDTRI